MIKGGIFFVLLFFSASLKASQLNSIDASLLQLALASAELPPQASLDLANQTIIICDEEFTNQTYGKILLECIARALKLKPTTQAIVIAQELAKLILDAPTSLQVLYTLTQLTQATTNMHVPHQTMLTPSEKDKDIDCYANQAVLSVSAALAPFLQQERKKMLFFWFSISISVAIGITFAASTYHYIKQQNETLAATQIQLKQTQITIDQLSTQITDDNLANTIQIKKNESIQQSLTQQQAIQESLAQQQAILQERIEKVNNNSHLAITEVQKHSIEGMRLIKQKLEGQQLFFDQCLASIDRVIEGTEDDAPEAIAEKITFTDIASWIDNARDIAQLLPALQTTHQISTALGRHRLPTR